MLNPRVWFSKSRSFPRRSFVSTDSVVIFGDTTIVSLEANTGKERAKKKWARCGEPWVEGGEVWVPTVKGLAVLDSATLETRREIASGRPKVDGEQIVYYGTLDGVSDGTLIRVGRPNKALDKQGTYRYYLTAFRLDGKKPLFTKLLLESSAHVHGAVAGGIAVCSWPAGCGNERPFRLVAHAAKDGAALAEAGTTDVGLVQPLGENVLVPRYRAPALVYDKGKFVELPAVGRVESHAGRTYILGHRELVRCGEDWKAAARRTIRTPEMADDSSRVEPSSLCPAGRFLRLVERIPPLLATWDQRGPMPRVEYVTRPVDPDSLKDAGAEETFEEDALFRLIGRSGEIWIAQIPGGFAGCRFPD